MGKIAARIRHKLADAFLPSVLEIFDESELHAGHAGARKEGETHFRVRIVADAFKGKTLLERHRMVYDVLGPELKEQIHAIAIAAQAPE